MKRHKDHGQQKRSRPAPTHQSVDRDMDDLEINISGDSFQRNLSKDDEDLINNPPVYRDRAAERRREEEENAKSQHLGQTKGLDFALLELQRKGIRTVDVLEGDTRSARIKLAAKRIIQLFSSTKDDRQCTGWKIKLSFSNSDRPMKVYDESLTTIDQCNNAKASQTTSPVFRPEEVKVIMNAWKSRRIIKDKLKSTVDQEIEGDESNKVDYAEEVQELSEDEEQLHQTEQFSTKKSQHAISEKPKVTDEIDDDDDFDMFGGGVLKKENVEEQSEVKGVDFMSLSLDDLKRMLEKVEAAIMLRKALDEQRQITVKSG